MRGLERVGARDWRQIDPRALTAAWPQLPVPALELETGGLEAVAERIASCCQTCELCGGAVLDRAPASARLRMIELWVCPRPQGSQLAALQRLTQAAIGSNPNVKTTSVYRDDKRIEEGYGWVANGEVFTLQADAIATGGEWIGNFQLGRCRSRDVKETWRINRDVAVRVTRADVEPRAGNERMLRFSYVTACLFGDRTCSGAELDRLWPTLRSRAAREKVTKIQVSPENCVGASMAFQLERSLDGRWGEGALWNPKGQ